MLSTGEINKSIFKGELDEDLDVILDVIRKRRESIDLANLAVLKPGMVVEFKDVRPKSLAGRWGIVKSVDLKEKKAQVHIFTTKGAGRRAGLPVGCPFSIIKRVADGDFLKYLCEGREGDEFGREYNKIYSELHEELGPKAYDATKECA